MLTPKEPITLDKWIQLGRNGTTMYESETLVVSRDGMRKLRDHVTTACPKKNGQLQLERFMLVNVLHAMADSEVPVTKEGSWVKRYRKILKRMYNIDGDELKTEWYLAWEGTLGSIVGEYTTKSNLVVRAVSTIDWHAGDFGDGGSCYWGDRSGAREAISNSPLHGAIQVWTTDGREGVGRCWFQTDRNRNYIALWNRYGAVRLTAIATAVQSILGYSHVAEVCPRTGNNDMDRYMLYLNGDCMVLSNAEWVGNDITIEIENIQRYYDYDNEECERCGGMYDPDVLTDVRGGGMWCPTCRNEHAHLCEYCEQYSSSDLVTWVEGGEFYVCSRTPCQTHLREDYTCCTDCGDWYDNSEMVVVDNLDYCEGCVPEQEPTAEDLIEGEK